MSICIYNFNLILLLTKDESSFCKLQIKQKQRIYNLKNDSCHIDDNSSKMLNQ